MAKALGQNALSKIVNWAKNTFATKTEANAIVPISRGGTGQPSAGPAVRSLGVGLSDIASTQVQNCHILAYDSSNGVRIPFSSIQTWVTNRKTSVEVADTNYTTSMGRGIALQTTVPTSINNGCIVGVY